MKILTQEEEKEHYSATIRGGLTGGIAGLAVGTLGVYGASLRYPAFRTLTLPFRAFIAVSSGTFASIVYADKASRDFERNRRPEERYVDKQSSLRQQAAQAKSTGTRLTDWAKENRYPIVFGSWIASMAAALAIVGRNPYLSTQQKLVQARVYAQGLTVAVLVTSFAFEASDQSSGQGRWETVKVLDPNDPTHQHIIEKKIHHERYAGEDQWRDMVEAEEQRLKEKKQMRERMEKKNGGSSDKKDDSKSDKKDNSKSDKKDDSKKEKADKPKTEQKTGPKAERRQEVTNMDKSDDMKESMEKRNQVTSTATSENTKKPKKIEEKEGGDDKKKGKSS